MNEASASPVAKLCDYTAKQAARFADCLGRALDDADADAVHDLRVASRRLALPLRLQEDQIGRRRGRRVRRALRSIRRTFREVRDLDVMIATLGRSLAGGDGAATHGSDIDSQDLAFMLAKLARRRERRLKEAHTRCRRLRAPQLATDLADLVPSASACGVPAERLEARVHDEFQTRVEALVAFEPRQEGRADLHALRIQLKRLRYTAELLGKVFDRPLKERIDAMTQMQDLLGGWNDRIVLSQAVADMARGRKLAAAEPLLAARLLEFAAWQVRSVEEHRLRIVEAWPRLQAALRPHCRTEQGILDVVHGGAGAGS